MKKYYLGIDLGTSAVKLLLAATDGERISVKCPYASQDPEGWLGGLQQAVQQLGSKAALSQIAGISLSSQVGTYLLDTGEELSWNSSAGKQELQEIKEAVTAEEWVQEIGMLHPDIISYPLPRLRYIQKHYPACRRVEMPKEWLLRQLTGNTVTDIFSWRGLCHPEKKAYSQALLERFGIDLQLPTVALPTDLAGFVTAAGAAKCGLPENVPVYVGCNDFFAGLLGMGVWDIGTAFELSGTSEHLGMITPQREDGKFVSGEYFNGNATYGGTKASGMACDFAIRSFGVEGLRWEQAFDNPPIFLPYLRGERAPIYDENAKGVFFGITDKTGKEDMAYAVLEGVVFSLYHIGEALQLENLPCLLTGGGSAVNTVMAKLKAALFDCPVYLVEEKDSSALGAAVIAMAGAKVYASLAEAVKAVAAAKCIAKPDKALRETLLRRYSLYKKIYANLKDCFQIFSER